MSARSDQPHSDWQREHRAALEELQEAQRAYHRAIAATAFSSTAEEPSVEQMRRASLEALDVARMKLDEIRARRPQSEAT